MFQSSHTLFRPNSMTSKSVSRKILLPTFSYISMMLPIFFFLWTQVENEWSRQQKATLKVIISWTWDAGVTVHERFDSMWISASTLYDATLKTTHKFQSKSITLCYNAVMFVNCGQQSECSVISLIIFFKVFPLKLSGINQESGFTRILEFLGC